MPPLFICPTRTSPLFNKTTSPTTSKVSPPIGFAFILAEVSKSISIFAGISPAPDPGGKGLAIPTPVIFKSEIKKPIKIILNLFIIKNMNKRIFHLLLVTILPILIFPSHTVYHKCRIFPLLSN